MHISLCTLKKEIKKIKLEFVTKDKFDETGVKRIVTITNAEENEFEGSVLECAAKFTIIVKKIPGCAAAELQCSSQVPVRRVRGDADCDHHQRGQEQALPEEDKNPG